MIDVALALASIGAVLGMMLFAVTVTMLVVDWLTSWIHRINGEDNE